VIFNKLKEDVLDQNNNIAPSATTANERMAEAVLELQVVNLTLTPTLSAVHVLPCVQEPVDGRLAARPLSHQLHAPTVSFRQSLAHVRPLHCGGMVRAFAVVGVAAATVVGVTVVIGATAAVVWSTCAIVVIVVLGSGKLQAERPVSYVSVTASVGWGLSMINQGPDERPPKMLTNSAFWHSAWPMQNVLPMNEKDRK
jgi:hypothetical protein